MRVIFAGTPEFAAIALDGLLRSEHEVALVLTQPDRPAGRGMQLRHSAVKERALAADLPLFQPPTLRDAEARHTLARLAADVMIVAAYGLILPPEVLAMPRLGCLNIHASLLPRWRGAAPIQRAILAGDTETGITIMQMEAGLDTGPMLLARSLPIAADDTAQSLHDKLAVLGAQAIVEALARGENLDAIPQDPARATYAAKLTKEEAQIDWHAAAETIGRAVRAYNPMPGAFTRRGGETLKIWAATPVPKAGAPGVVLAADHDGIVVGCGAGALGVVELQRAGGKRLPAAQFLAGCPISPGEQWA